MLTFKSIGKVVLGSGEPVCIFRRVAGRPELGMFDPHVVGRKWLGGEVHERRYEHSNWWSRKRCVEAKVYRIECS